MMEVWLDEAKKVSSVDLEICFLIHKEFYYGPDTHTAVMERKEVEILPSPNIPRKVESMIRTQEVLGQEDELIAYYRAVIDAAKSHQKELGQIGLYFWMRLWIWNTEQNVHIDFPWYDTYAEMERFFQCVKEGAEGQIFFDIDQGWELVVYARDGEFIVRRRDHDSEDGHAEMVRFAAKPFLQQIEELRERTTSIIARLSTAVGRDFWTNHVQWLEHSSPINISVPKKKPWWQLW